MDFRKANQTNITIGHLLLNLAYGIVFLHTIYLYQRKSRAIWISNKRFSHLI